MENGEKENGISGCSATNRNSDLLFFNKLQDFVVRDRKLL